MNPNSKTSKVSGVKGVDGSKSLDNVSKTVVVMPTLAVISLIGEVIVGVGIVCTNISRIYVVLL